MIVSLKKNIAIIVFWISTAFSGIAQIPDSLASGSLPDTTKLNADSTSIHPSRLKTASNVLKGVILSTPGDFKQMGHILSDDWTRTAACLGGIAVVVLADKPVTQFYQDYIEKNIDYNLPSLPGSNSGLYFRGNDAYLNYSILGLYSGSLLANYKTGQRAAVNSIKALTYSYLICHVGLKALFARHRPDPKLSDGIPPRGSFTDNPHDFFNFRDINFGTGAYGTSFPSMHSTAYFAVAKVMAMEFNNYWIPYGAISIIFLADLDSHQHWVGDMIAGGLLGTLMGKAIVTSSRKWEKKQLRKNQGITLHHKLDFNYKILPMVFSSAVGFSLNASF